MFSGRIRELNREWLLRWAIQLEYGSQSNLIGSRSMKLPSYDDDDDDDDDQEED